MEKDSTVWQKRAGRLRRTVADQDSRAGYPPTSTFARYTLVFPSCDE